MLRMIRILGILALAVTCAVSVSAQRKSVSGAEVTGTFSYSFTGKFRGSSSTIQIQALGKGRLKIGFDLIYPFIDGAGEMSANLGQLTGEATITGDTAIYESNEYGQCKITIKFARPGSIKVTEESDGSGCGFGHNVTANGTFKKTSSKKPKFEEL